ASRTCKVRPTVQVVFHGGRIDRAMNASPFDCGCAAPPPPMMLASAEPAPQAVSEKNLSPNVQLPSSSAAAPAPRAVLDPMLPPLPNASRPAVAIASATQPGNVTTGRAETAPPPRAKPSDIHVQIEAP